jgi:hypothetical protein
MARKVDDLRGFFEHGPLNVAGAHGKALGKGKLIAVLCSPEPGFDIAQFFVQAQAAGGFGVGRQNKNFLHRELRPFF